MSEATVRGERVQGERYCRGCGYAFGAVAVAASGAGESGSSSCACPECGRGFDPADALSTRGSEREGVRGLGGWGAPVFASALAVGAHGYSFVTGDHVVLWIAAVLAAAPLLLAVVAAATPSMRMVAGLRAMTLVSAALFLLVVTTSWPFRMAFSLNRGAMQRYALRVQAGTAPVDAGPVWVGIMRIRNVGQSPWGSVGFQFSGRDFGVVAVWHTAGTGRAWYNTNWERNVGGGWYLVWQD